MFFSFPDIFLNKNIDKLFFSVKFKFFTSFFGGKNVQKFLLLFLNKYLNLK
jgi:hypothetical protein